MLENEETLKAKKDGVFIFEWEKLREIRGAAANKTATSVLDTPLPRQTYVKL